jgi:hypothetical protein
MNEIERRVTNAGIAMFQMRQCGLTSTRQINAYTKSAGDSASLDGFNRYRKQPINQRTFAKEKEEHLRRLAAFKLYNSKLKDVNERVLNHATLEGLDIFLKQQKITDNHIVLLHRLLFNGF